VACAAAQIVGALEVSATAGADQAHVERRRMKVGPPGPDGADEGPVIGTKPTQDRLEFVGTGGGGARQGGAGERREQNSPHIPA